MKHCIVQLECLLKVPGYISDIISLINAYSTCSGRCDVHIDVHQQLSLFPFLLHEARWLDTRQFKFLIVFSAYLLLHIFLFNSFFLVNLSHPVYLFVIALWHLLLFFVLLLLNQLFLMIDLGFECTLLDLSFFLGRYIQLLFMLFDLLL